MTHLPSGHPFIRIDRCQQHAFFLGIFRKKFLLMCQTVQLGFLFCGNTAVCCHPQMLCHIIASSLPLYMQNSIAFFPKIAYNTNKLTKTESEFYV